MTQILVHHLNNSKSQRILWLLEELGLGYEIKFYRRAPVFAPPELRAIHPLGKAPIVEIDGMVMAESAAVVEYLVLRHGAGRLSPAPDQPEYARYLELLHYPEGSANMPILFNLLIPMMGVKHEGFEAYAAGEIKLHLDYMEGLLEGREYLVGDRFSAADLQLTFILQMADAGGLLAARPWLEAFVARMEARPAYLRAIEKGGPFDLKFGR